MSTTRTTSNHSRGTPGPEQHRRPRRDGGPDDDEHQGAAREGVARRQRADDRARHDGRDDHEREHDTRLPRGEALTGDEEGEAPEHREHVGRELGREVRPQAEPGAGHEPGGPQRAPERPQPQLVAVLVDPGAVLDEQHERDARDDAEGGCDGIRRGPSEGVQCCGEGTDSGEGAELTEQPGELRHERRSPRGEPQRDQAQHRDEDHRVTDAEQHPAQQRERVRVDEREGQLRDRQEGEPDREHPLRPVTVEQRPDGQLHQRIDEDLQDGEGRQLGRRDAEALGSLEARHPERGAVEDGEDVDRDGRAPDRPGLPAVERIAQPGGRGHQLTASITPIHLTQPTHTRTLSTHRQRVPIIGIDGFGALGTQSTIALATVLLMSGWKTLGMM